MASETNHNQGLDTKSLITIISVIVAVCSLLFAAYTHMRSEDQGQEGNTRSSHEQRDAQEGTQANDGQDNQKDGETNDSNTPAPSQSPKQ